MPVTSTPSSAVFFENYVFRYLLSFPVLHPFLPLSLSLSLSLSSPISIYLRTVEIDKQSVKVVPSGAIKTDRARNILRPSRVRSSRCNATCNVTRYIRRCTLDHAEMSSGKGGGGNVRNDRCHAFKIDSRYLRAALPSSMGSREKNSAPRLPASSIDVTASVISSIRGAHCDE